MKTQVNNLKSTVYQLCDQIRTLSSSINTGDSKNKNPNTRTSTQTHNRGTQGGMPADNIIWATRLLWDSS